MTDISPLNLRGKLSANTAQGPRANDDSSLTSTADVLEVDAAHARVRVNLRGGNVWLPAVAGRYGPDSLARVLIDATSARPVLVLGPVMPLSPTTLGSVDATSAGSITTTVRGVQSTLPAPLGTYTVGQSAWVLLDDWGIPVVALGPSTVPAPGAGGTVPSEGGNTVSATAIIGPQVSGTWSVSAGKWDTYNTNRYGGPSDVYQGPAFNNSGILRGFAGYGDQVVNLGALSIEEIALVARKTGDGLTSLLQVQGSPSGTRPAGSPASAGEIASSSAPVPSGTVGTVLLTAAMREAFRTGAAKGLAAVGTQYGGFGGTATAGSFVLHVRYTKNV